MKKAKLLSLSMAACMLFLTLFILSSPPAENGQATAPMQAALCFRCRIPGRLSPLSDTQLPGFRICAGYGHIRSDGMLCVHFLLENSGDAPLSLPSLQFACTAGGQVSGSVLTAEHMLSPGSQTACRVLFQLPPETGCITIRVTKNSRSIMGDFHKDVLFLRSAVDNFDFLQLFSALVLGERRHNNEGLTKRTLATRFVRMASRY